MRLLLVCGFLVGMGALLTVGCGSKDKCQNDSDCPLAQVCRLDQVTGGKACQTSFVTPQCQPACATGQQCVNGKCVTLCDPPCKANQACQAGTCVDVSKPCDPPCKANQTCQAGTCVDVSKPCSPPCSARDTCIEGVCVPKEELPSTDSHTGEAPVTPDDAGAGDTKPGDRSTSCSSDNDCTSGFQCEQGRCVPRSSPEQPTGPDDGGVVGERPTDAAPPQDQPPADRPAGCQQNSDCSSGLICQAGKCVSAACAGACKDSEQCVSGKCVAEQNANIGAACSAQKPCAAGLSCLEISPQESRCLQTCKVPADCANNALRKACLQLTANQSYCVQIATQGQKCGLLGKVQAICDSQSVCQDDVCQKPVEVKPQEACGTQGRVCGKGYLCLRFPAPGGVFYSYCLQECTVGSGSCPGGGSCEALNGSFGFCLPPGQADHDDECGAQTGGPTFDTKRVCKPGLSCVGLVRSICLKFANGDCTTSNLSCPPNRKCQLITGPQGQKFSICSLVCGKDSDCGKSHMACDPNLKTCWPKR